ncbi:MAG: nucleotide exchange factor GrpE [Spirochaetaceae bacterium]|jgi:molecular chaperone GrpE|nr:nucleotide exchange factor GrpE [Spirochaetaceae bacterium]
MSKHHSHVKKEEENPVPPAEDTDVETTDQAGEEASAEQDARADQCGGKDEAPPEPAEDAEERIQALEEQLREAGDQYLRKAAEFENFRKRMNREKQEAIDFANQSLLQDLIPVIDDFERAIKSAETSRDFDGFYEGISMIEKRLISQLENKWALKRFDSAGESFDPNRHEAIMMEKSAEITEPVVQEDFLKGFTLKDRVIRSAKVKVLMPENPRAEEPAEAEEPAASTSP